MIKPLVIALALMVAGLMLAPSAQSQSLKEIYKEFEQHRQAGRYGEAERFAKQALDVCEARFGRNRSTCAPILSSLAFVYKRQGRYADAEKLYQRALPLQETALGANHPDVAQTLAGLAGVYQSQGKYADAEGLYRRALAIQEKALGTSHRDVASTLIGMAILYSSQGKYADAEGLYRRALPIQEKALGASHLDVALTLNNLAVVYWSQGRYADAEGLFQRALAMREKALGANHPDVGQTVNNLAIISASQGKYADAEGLFQRALAIREKALGALHPDVAMTLNNLANVHKFQGKYTDAERLYRRALAIQEKALGPNHLDVALTLNNLATVYESQVQYADAEGLFQRALAIREKALGANHPDVALNLNTLAGFYQSRDKYTDAERLYRRALAIREQALGPNHPDTAHSLVGLANVSRLQGKYADTEDLYRRALAIQEKALAPDHPDVAMSLNNLAALYHIQGRYTDAEPLYKRSLAVKEKSLGPAHPDVALSLNNLAGLYLARSRWREALPLVRTATERGHVNRGTHFSILLGARRANDLSEDAAIAESFVVAQRTTSTAASAALTQLAVRFAAGADELAQLVRKDQDLAAEHEKLDKDLVTAFSKPPNERDANRENAIRKRLEEIAASRAEVGRVLAQRFPNYSALSKPRPLSVNDTSSLLADDEALVLIDLGKEKGEGYNNYVWVVDRSGAVWNPIDAKSEDLEAQIAALRASLDPDSAKPFDAKLAHRLYKSILGPVEDRIAKKPRLLMVMNGALTSIPPQVLVTADPAGKDLKSTDWLIRRHAIAILPSVYSLKILRGKQAGASVPKPLIGFGDPVFGKGRPEIRTTRIAVSRGYDSFYRAGTADLDVLARALPPLPDTAIELRAVAKSLGASETDLKLGSAATVTAVKQTKLDQYRIVYFATHALVSGETEQAAKGLAEPALVLSLPSTATAFDDGLLTASEVAQLKLNADWVVLSACNTAAAEKPGAEALSGLARAFFYAGARALLVSHWPVESDLAAQLMTTMFASIAKDPKLTTAEALRQAMLSTMNDRSHPDWANPSSWAPFILVGEGGVMRR